MFAHSMVILPFLMSTVGGARVVVPAVAWNVVPPGHEHARSVAVVPLPANQFERIDRVAGGFACVSGSLGKCSATELGRIDPRGAALDQWSPLGSAKWLCVRSRIGGSPGVPSRFELVRADFANGDERVLESSATPLLLSESPLGSVSTFVREAEIGWVVVRDCATLEGQSRTPVACGNRAPSAFLVAGAHTLLACEPGRDEIIQFELQDGTYTELHTIAAPIPWKIDGLCLLGKSPVLEAHVGDEAMLGLIDAQKGIVEPLAMKWPDSDEYKPPFSAQYSHGTLASIFGSASKAAAVVDDASVWINVNASALTCNCQWTCTRDQEILCAGRGQEDTLLILLGERKLGRFAAKDGRWLQDLGTVPTGSGRDGLAILAEMPSGRIFLQRDSLDPDYAVRDPVDGEWKRMTLPGDLVAEDASGGLICIRSGKLVRARSIEALTDVETLLELEGIRISRAIVTAEGLCCLAEPFVIAKCMTDPADAGKPVVVASPPALLFTDTSGRIRSRVELPSDVRMGDLAPAGADVCIMNGPRAGWLVSRDGTKRAFEARLSPGSGLSGWYAWLGSTSTRQISLVDRGRGRIWMLDPGSS